MNEFTIPLSITEPASIPLHVDTTQPAPEPKLQEKAVTVTENGERTVTPDDGYDGLSEVEITTDVPNSYTAGDEGKVVSSGALVAQTSRSITQNGATDTTTNNEVIVNVPNSYVAADEGKVVSNGALVAQTAHATVTSNGTYDTTRNNSMTVAVPKNVTIEFVLNSVVMSARTFTTPIDKLTLHNVFSGNNNVTLASACSQFSGASVIELIVDKPVSTINNAFDTCRAGSIILNGIDFSVCTNFRQAFSGNNIEGLEVVVSGTPLDLSAAASSNNIQGLIGQNIKDIRFVPSSCKYSWSLPAPIKASDDTLVSIANALDGTATGQTLTIHASKKSRCSEIVGKVTDGLFAIDASGTVTLADFITQVKGWTLA